MYQLRSDGWKEELAFMKKEKKMEVLSKHKAVFKQDVLTDDGKSPREPPEFPTVSHSYRVDQYPRRGCGSGGALSRSPGTKRRA